VTATVDEEPSIIYLH